MSYRIRYSARQGSYYIEVDGSAEDFGTSLYDTEEEAFAELARMVSEGLISPADIKGLI